MLFGFLRIHNVKKIKNKPVENVFHHDKSQTNSCDYKTYSLQPSGYIFMMHVHTEQRLMMKTSNSIPTSPKKKKELPEKLPKLHKSHTCSHHHKRLRRWSQNWCETINTETLQSQREDWKYCECLWDHKKYNWALRVHNAWVKCPASQKNSSFFFFFFFGVEHMLLAI